MLKHIFTPFPETIFISEKTLLVLRCVLEAYTTIAIFKQKKRRILIFTLSKELIHKVIQIIQSFITCKYPIFVFYSY